MVPCFTSPRTGLIPTSPMTKTLQNKIAASIKLKTGPATTMATLAMTD